MRTILILLAITVTAAGCITGGKYKPVATLTPLAVSFADAAWDGKRVPDGQQCRRDDGRGGTPPLVIDNLPPGTNAIIMEFSDRSVDAMNHGGHGKVGFRIPVGVARVEIPSAPGNTFALPKGFFMVGRHRNPAWDKAGAYLPPCSGGRGNTYEVDIKAVFDAPKGQASKLLGTARLTMGTY